MADTPQNKPEQPTIPTPPSGLKRLQDGADDYPWIFIDSQENTNFIPVNTDGWVFIKYRNTIPITHHQPVILDNVSTWLHGMVDGTGAAVKGEYVMKGGYTQIKSFNGAEVNVTANDWVGTLENSSLQTVNLYDSHFTISEASTASNIGSIIATHNSQVRLENLNSLTSIEVSDESFATITNGQQPREVTVHNSHIEIFGSPNETDKPLNISLSGTGYAFMREGARTLVGNFNDNRSNTNRPTTLVGNIETFNINTSNFENGLISNIFENAVLGSPYIPANYPNEIGGDAEVLIKKSSTPEGSTLPIKLTDQGHLAIEGGSLNVNIVLEPSCAVDNRNVNLSIHDNTTLSGTIELKAGEPNQVPLPGFHPGKNAFNGTIKIDTNARYDTEIPNEFTCNAVQIGNVVYTIDYSKLTTEQRGHLNRALDDSLSQGNSDIFIKATEEHINEGRITVNELPLPILPDAPFHTFFPVAPTGNACVTPPAAGR